MVRKNNTGNFTIFIIVIGFIIFSNFPILGWFVVFGVVLYFIMGNVSIDKVISNTGLIEKLAEKNIIDAKVLKELNGQNGNKKFIQLLEELKKSDKYRKDRILQKRRDLEDKLNEGNSSLRIKDTVPDLNKQIINYGTDDTYFEETKTYVNGKETNNFDFPTYGKDDNYSVFVDEDIIIPEEKLDLKDLKKSKFKIKKEDKNVISDTYSSSSSSIWDNYSSVMDDFKK